MPTYTYQCKRCNYKYDKFQKISEHPDKECPECKGEVERLIGGGIGIVFKGTGFYVTDYKKNNSQKSENSKTINKKESTENKTQTKNTA